MTDNLVTISYLCQFVTKNVNFTGMLVSMGPIHKTFQSKVKNLLIQSDSKIFDRTHTYDYLT